MQIYVNIDSMSFKMKINTKRKKMDINVTRFKHKILNVSIKVKIITQVNMMNNENFVKMLPIRMSCF